MGWKDAPAVTSDEPQWKQAPAIEAPATESLSALPPAPEWRVHPFVSGVKKAALPMIGSAAGQFVGGTPGAMGGAGIGEYVNQKLGITEESPGQMLWQAGSQAIIPTIGYLWRLGKTMGPAVGAAALNKLAPQEITEHMAQYAPTIPSKTLFDQAQKLGGSVPLAKTVQEMDDVLVSISKGSPALQEQYGMTKNFLTKLQGHLAKYGGQLPPSMLQEEMAGLGRVVGKLDRAGDKVNAPFLKRIFGSLSDDLDDAAKGLSPAITPESAAFLQGARTAFKREATIKDVLEAVQDATSVKARAGDTVQFAAQKLLNSLPGEKFFQQAFTKAEKDSILGLLTTLNKIPAPPPGAGATWGSGRIWQSMAGFGGAGAAVGNVPGGGLGLAIGAVAPAIKDMATNIALANKTALGRELLKSLMQSSLPPTQKMFLSQAMAAAASQTSKLREQEVRTQEYGIPEPERLLPSFKLAGASERY